MCSLWEQGFVDRKLLPEKRQLRGDVSDQTLMVAVVDVHAQQIITVKVCSMSWTANKKWGIFIIDGFISLTLPVDLFIANITIVKNVWFHLELQCLTLKKDSFIRFTRVAAVRFNFTYLSIIQPFIFCSLSGVRSQVQRPTQGDPDFQLTMHLTPLAPPRGGESMGKGTRFASSAGPHVCRPGHPTLTIERWPVSKSRFVLHLVSSLT